MFLSAGDKQLAIYCHVPKALAEAKGLGAKEWMDALTAPLKGVEVRAGGIHIMQCSYYTT